MSVSECTLDDDSCRDGKQALWVTGVSRYSTLLCIAKVKKVINDNNMYMSTKIKCCCIYRSDCWSIDDGFYGRYFRSQQCVDIYSFYCCSIIRVVSCCPNWQSDHDLQLDNMFSILSRYWCWRCLPIVCV